MKFRSEVCLLCSYSFVWWTQTNSSVVSVSLCVFNSNRKQKNGNPVKGESRSESESDSESSSSESGSESGSELGSDSDSGTDQKKNTRAKPVQSKPVSKVSPSTHPELCCILICMCNIWHPCFFSAGREKGSVSAWSGWLWVSFGVHFNCTVFFFLL